MKNVIEKMSETPLVFDGAMGTMIYEKGVFIIEIDFNDFPSSPPRVCFKTKIIHLQSVNGTIFTKFLHYRYWEQSTTRLEILVGLFLIFKI